jgi:hypothetical protein
MNTHGLLVLGRLVPRGGQVRQLCGLIAVIHGSLRLLGARAAGLTWGESMWFGLLLSLAGLWLLATMRWRWRWWGRLPAVMAAAVWGSFATAVWTGSQVSAALALLYTLCMFVEIVTHEC